MTVVLQHVQDVTGDVKPVWLINIPVQVAGVLVGMLIFNANVNLSSSSLGWMWCVKVSQSLNIRLCGTL